MRGARAVLAAVGACVGLGAQGPQQLSLALTAAGPTEMAIAWVSLDAWTPATAGSVTWASSATPEHEDSAPARTHTYSAGFGWNGESEEGRGWKGARGAWRVGRSDSSVARPARCAIPYRLHFLGDNDGAGAVSVIHVHS